MKIECEEEISSPREAGSSSGPLTVKIKAFSAARTTENFPMPRNKSRLARRARYLFPQGFIRSISSRSPRGVFAGKRVALSFGLSLLSEPERAEREPIDRFSPSLQPRMQMVPVSARRSTSCLRRQSKNAPGTLGSGVLNHRHCRNNKMQIRCLAGV